MVKWLSYIILSLSLSTLVSCVENQTLEIKRVGDSSGIFIECYCCVDKLYNLTATYLSPIDEAQHLDYSYDFEAYITDSEEHRLSQGLFYNDGYLYSHGSTASLSADFDGELQLLIITPDGEELRASTAIPDPVTLKEVSYDSESESVTVVFDSSDDPSQNYFFVSVVFTDIYSKVERAVKRAINISESGEQSVTISRREDEEEKYSDAQYIDVSIRRFTADGYAYQYSLLENSESTSSNIIVGIPLSSNIEGATGVFTCYSVDELRLVTL